MLYSPGAFWYTTGQCLRLVKGIYVNPIILMVKGKTRYRYVSAESIQRIEVLVSQWKFGQSFQTLWILSHASETQSTAVTVQSKYGEGSHIKYYMQSNAADIARKTLELSRERPVVVVLKESALLHRVAKWLRVPVEYGTFKTTEGVVLDLFLKTYDVFTAE